MIGVVAGTATITATSGGFSDTSEVPVKNYAVGDTGPAGGIVLYVMGSFSDGWKYLESAPADLRVVNGNPTVDSTAEGYQTDYGRTGGCRVRPIRAL